MERNSSNCKLSLIISIIALIIASMSYFCPKKATDPLSASTFDEKVKGIIIDTIKQDPQLLMDAMGEGIAKKREAAIGELTNGVLDKSSEITKQSMKFGELSSKTNVVCFFDPLCKHCNDFQRSMTKLVKAKKDVCFKTIPVAVLGDDSVTLAKVYISVYEKSPEKALTFIEKITSLEGDINKSEIEKALKTAGLDPKEIEGMLTDSDKKLIANGKLAEALKIPVVPAIFIVKGKEVSILQTTGIDQLLAAIEGKPGK